MNVIQEEKEQVSFQYANECDLEIHCSPFGLSGLYIKVRGTNIMGIGSTMGLITGSTKGYIHYNDCQDLIDQKYKLYVIVDEDGMLRIDFTKISPISKASEELENKLTQGLQAREESETKKEVTDDFIGKSPNSGENSSYSSSLKSPQNNQDKNDGKEDGADGEDDAPTLIFRGKCPDGRPDNIEPFIGIFSFERED